MAFSPDGTTIASGALNESTHFWDVVTGELKGTLKGDAGRNSSEICYSPDGTTLAASGGGSIHLWDIASGQPKATLRGHTDFMRSIVYSPNGSTLASANQDDTVRLWDAATGESKAVLKGHTDSVASVAYSPDGTTLASGGYDGTIMLWNIPTKNAPMLSLSPSKFVSPAIGQELTLSLNIKKSENIEKYQATVQFDSTALRYVGSNSEDDLFASETPVLEGNNITLSGTRASKANGGIDTLAELKFQVILTKPSTLTISKIHLTDRTDTIIHPWLEDGEIIALPSSKEDVNFDGVVNFQDLRKVASNFGQGRRSAADVNGDEIVNIVDLTLVTRAMGPQQTSE